MSWKNDYLPLTEDQKERGVVYSSVLIVTNNPDLNRTLHEVMADDPRKDEKIKLLQDVTFFKNMAASCGWNVVNEIRQ